MQIFKFNKNDWQHVAWLFKNMIKQFFLGDFHEAREAFLWIKIHCIYESKRNDQ